ncbi:MAG TPA: NADH-quinone oxidoreductase subunit C [Anaeromyxobacteraceae bacterium]|nr:NADH-quinone oxidoreductase subunit C [Anaeromyxobacteraceae bacterium]
MTTGEIHEKLKGRFGDAVGPLSEPKIDPFCAVKAECLVDACRWLKGEPGLELDFCEDLTAVDWPRRNVIEVVYHLFSYRHRHGIVLKVEADRERPVVPSVEGVWKAANFMEREVYDLFGVTFTGHPDLRRILLPDDWVGHPLRKDYQEAGGYHGVPNLRENPLVELRRLDEVRLAERAKGPSPSGRGHSDPPHAAGGEGSAAPAAAPAAPATPKA